MSYTLESLKEMSRKELDMAITNVSGYRHGGWNKKQLIIYLMDIKKFINFKKTKKELEKFDLIDLQDFTTKIIYDQYDDDYVRDAILLEQEAFNGNYNDKDINYDLENNKYIIKESKNEESKNEESKNEESKNESNFNSTYTLTFADTAENHKGMQIIGNNTNNTFSCQELLEISKKVKNSEYYNLNDLIENDLIEKEAEEASILIIRKCIENSDLLFTEQSKLVKDTKALMKGRVVNKIARHNACFADFSQDPDYEKGKGTIYNFKDLTELTKVREFLPSILGDKTKNLIAEGNYYYDLNKCYIGWHGDTERNMVIGIRLGETFPLHYNWWYKLNPIGKTLSIDLNHGDVYIMSKKAVGTDWRKQIIPTLRHSASKIVKF